MAFRSPTAGGFFVLSTLFFDKRNVEPRWGALLRPVFALFLIGVAASDAEVEKVAASRSEPGLTAPTMLGLCRQRQHTEDIL